MKETLHQQLLRLAAEAEARAATRRSSIDRNDDLAEARNMRASAALVRAAEEKRCRC